MELALGFFKGAKGPLSYAKPALQTGERSSLNYSGLAHSSAIINTIYEGFIQTAVERDKPLNLYLSHRLDAAKQKYISLHRLF